MLGSDEALDTFGGDDHGYVKTNQLTADDTIGRYAGASYVGLGINDSTSSNAVILYPNPTQDELFI